MFREVFCVKIEVREKFQRAAPWTIGALSAAPGMQRFLELKSMGHIFHPRRSIFPSCFNVATRKSQLSLLRPLACGPLCTSPLASNALRATKGRGHHGCSKERTTSVFAAGGEITTSNNNKKGRHQRKRVRCAGPPSLLSLPPILNARKRRGIASLPHSMTQRLSSGVSFPLLNG